MNRFRNSCGYCTADRAFAGTEADHFVRPSDRYCVGVGQRSNEKEMEPGLAHPAPSPNPSQRMNYER